MGTLNTPTRKQVGLLYTNFTYFGFNSNYSISVRDEKTTMACTLVLDNLNVLFDKIKDNPVTPNGQNNTFDFIFKRSQKKYNQQLYLVKRIKAHLECCLY